MKQSLFRKLTNKKLSTISLSGAVLDIGGSHDASYHKLFQGDYTVTAVNIQKDTDPDVVLDIDTEKLPFNDESYDAVLLINLLEHVYDYKHVLSESYRVLKQEGKLIAVVPFLYYIHPSPNDYFRYSKQALKKILADNNFSSVEVIGIGCGAFSASHNLLHRFFPSFVSVPFEWFARGIDIFLRKSAQLLGKKYDGTEYALGYVVTAQKK
tara:strand:+ start:14836 stop:15465 length:630 start_codon:yes stop_codon:yes gene_type:complete